MEPKDDKLKYWLRQLCKNMNHAIEENGGIHQCIDHIKAQGFDLCVFLEATVCLTQAEDDSAFEQFKKKVSTAKTDAPKERQRKLRLSRSDKGCLSSLRIGLPAPVQEASRE